MGDLPRLIKSIRMGLGETQEQFGKRFDVDHNAVMHWEKGKDKRIPVKLVEFLVATEPCNHCGGKGFTMRGKL